MLLPYTHVHGITSALQAGDAWLCSGSLRLLSGDVNSALGGLLGWQEPLSVSTLGTQLVELGKLHPEVTNPLMLPSARLAHICRE